MPKGLLSTNGVNGGVNSKNPGTKKVRRGFTERRFQQHSTNLNLTWNEYNIITVLLN